MTLNSVWAFVVSLLIQGISSGFVFPAFNTFWQPKVEKEYRTTLVSIFSFLVGILSTSGAFLAGVIIDNFGIVNLNNFILFFVLIGLAFGLILRYTRGEKWFNTVN
jgi:MFS family permease